MTRSQFAPPQGALPVLQYLQPVQLAIDAAYQRSLATAPSRNLVSRIAREWNWALCQPLVVSRRDGGYFVIDGQHRLAAANQRGDLQVLPCVVVDYSDAAAEAAAFVHLNKQRRPLSALDIFRAAVAAGDEEAMAIEAAIGKAGLHLATSNGNNAMPAGVIWNIAGIQRAWRQHGEAAATLGLHVLADAFEGQVLRYAGTIWPGIPAIIAEEAQDWGYTDELTAMLRTRPQADWFAAINAEVESGGASQRVQAAERVLSAAWDEALGALLAEEDPDELTPQTSIDLNTVPSGMEQLAASWRKPHA